VLPAHSTAFEGNSTHFGTHILLPKICELLAVNGGQMFQSVMDEEAHFHLNDSSNKLNCHKFTEKYSIFLKL
jgi:hypothetical protein